MQRFHSCMAVCEMCGSASSLLDALVDGAELRVCTPCSLYGKVKPPAMRPMYTPKVVVSRSQPEFKVIDNCSTIIRNARNSRNMNREVFAQFLNEKSSIVAHWESGSLKPKLETARALEKKLGIKLVQKDERGEYQAEKSVSAELTLGDFVKIRKR